MDLKKEFIQRKIKQETENEYYSTPETFINSTNLLKVKFEETNFVSEDAIENELHALINCGQPEESPQLKECKVVSITKTAGEIPDRQICRLCAQPIRGNEVYLYANGDLEQKINYTLPISTKVGDGLPEYMCRNCEINLNLFYNFVCQVVNADKSIREKVNQTDFKSSDVTNATIKEIFGADISELEGTKVTGINKEDNFTKRSLEQEGTESKNSNDLRTSTLRDKKPNRFVHHEDEDKNRKVPRMTESAPLQLPKKPQYKCHRCDQNFNDYLNVIDHNKKIHNMIEYPCPDCTKVFATENTLCQHIKDNHNVPVICQNCGKIFVHVDALDKHQENVHNAKVCNDCGMTFKSVAHFKTHRSLHLNIVHDFQCVYCYKLFDARHKLHRHTRQSHSGDYTLLIDNKAENEDDSDTEL
ncbi:hypothetical protein ILUMI_10440 [Ignelater luminosus]|uniref:Uncharacterized protein n=1 Tax=Ignelater luminosus TaxID=2038154 RepID=A0A8K0D242_IGNLU|nr:hypothetical protein ILUMI_10440 [Ignelater luminosus]